MQAAIYYKEDESVFLQIKFLKNEQNLSLDLLEIEASIQNDLKISDPVKLKEILSQLMQCFQLPEKTETI